MHCIKETQAIFLANSSAVGYEKTMFGLQNPGVVCGASVFWAASL